MRDKVTTGIQHRYDESLVDMIEYVESQQLSQSYHQGYSNQAESNSFYYQYH